MKENEVSDESEKSKKRTGYTWIAAGALFFLAAAGGKQPAFFGIGAMFLAIGASYLRKSK